MTQSGHCERALDWRHQGLGATRPLVFALPTFTQRAAWYCSGIAFAGERRHFGVGPLRHRSFFEILRALALTQAGCQTAGAAPIAM